MAKLLPMPFRITAMDPGKDTGLSLMRIDATSFCVEETTVVHHRSKGKELLQVLESWVNRTPKMPSMFLYENFHIRPNQKSVNTTPIEVIGLVNAWITVSKPYSQVVVKEPTSGKYAVQDSVLRRVGILERGGVTRHSNDALRHTVSWLMTQRYVPMCIAAFGPPPKRRAS